MSLPKNFATNAGFQIPSVLYGSYKSNGDNGTKAMVYALDKAGYHGIDTALFYGNHADVKKALQETKVPRDQLILQTKIWPTQLREPEKWLDVAIKELGTYIDVLLIHWPLPLRSDNKLDEGWDFVKAWKLFEALPKDKVRAIGVSNFTIKQLKKLLAEAKVVPVVNQVELHPELPQEKLVEFCKSHNILPQAYRPLAGGQTDNPVLQKIAKKHGITTGQVALSWNVQRGVVVLPKSENEGRIASNITLHKLDDEDLAEIAELGKSPRRQVGSEKIYSFNYFDEDE